MFKLKKIDFIVSGRTYPVSERKGGCCSVSFQYVKSWGKSGCVIAGKSLGRNSRGLGSRFQLTHIEAIWYTEYIGEWGEI